MVAAATTGMRAAGQAAQPELVPVVWLERAEGAPAGTLPAFRAVQDPARVDQAARLADNEAARFVRHLIARAWRLSGAVAADKPVPELPIVLQPGGNYARNGLRVLHGGTYAEQPDTPYLLLDATEGSLSLTFLHEGGHVIDRIMRRVRPEAQWSAVPHSTFAVTNPRTALSEGYAIHLETVWGHYGAAADRRAWYHHLDPQWSPDRALAGEFFAPVRDLLSFSQNWARYRGVRDGDVAFEGHVYEGDYLQSQYRPSRDLSQLRNGNGMIAAEGVVAAVLFWIVDGEARRNGAEPFRGLAQTALADAELRLAAALQKAAAVEEPLRPDLVDVVAAYGDDAATRRHAVERLVGVTRGVTARPAVRADWAALHEAAMDLDINVARAAADRLEAIRRELVDAGVKDAGTLRAGIGPQLPVRLAHVTAELKALGKPFPVEFDLNAMGPAELQLLTADAAARARVRAERDRQPFASYDDFERRTGITLPALRATPLAIGSALGKDR